MEVKKWLKDKRVWYGAAAIAGIAIVFFFIRGKASTAVPASDDGNSDTGYLYFPIGAGATGGGNASATNDPTASLIDLTGKQITSQTQLGIAAIGSDFLSQIAEKFKAKMPYKSSGVSGEFGFDPAGMLDFDFSFKAPLPKPASPPQNVKQTPIPVKTPMPSFQGNK